jgi:hypothetical protein
MHHSISIYLDASQVRANDDGHVTCKFPGRRISIGRLESREKSLSWSLFIYCSYTVHRCFSLFMHLCPEHQNKSFSFVENFKKNHKQTRSNLERT